MEEGVSCWGVGNHRNINRSRASFFPLFLFSETFIIITNSYRLPISICNRNTNIKKRNTLRTLTIIPQQYIPQPSPLRSKQTNINMPSTSLIAHSLILALAPLVARADLGIPDDISANCQSICRPVWQLGQACDVDDDLIRNKPTEDALNAQCYCLNNSFDVRSITGLCASCIQQNPAIDGDDQFPEYDDARGKSLSKPP